ncbi:MAG: hydrolase [Thalassobius sp.]|nr:hydrolase [Thalassovita sp.]
MTTITMQSKLCLLFGLLFLLITPSVSGQNLNTDKAVQIKSTSDRIVLDGVLNETTWQTADVGSDFYQMFPYDTSFAATKTEFKLSYDEKNFYVAIICHDIEKGGYVTSSLRRDFRGRGYDGVSVVIDPFQDRTNAFLFGTNPFGVQREGLISNGGTISGDLSLSWDNKWYVKTKIYPEEQYWVAEMAIPFKTLRYKEGLETWNINLYRIDSKSGERSSWVKLSRNLRPYNLGLIGKAVWDKPTKKPGANISLIPYVSGNISKNHLESGETESVYNFGGDAKIAVTPSLNLDLTFNPDFSQVEVDEQVTNLDRFEISFPEKRQFFLENGDLFANFGLEDQRPFFSRRIGVAIDSVTGQNVQNDILMGARLSGRINKDWRIGLLSMQGAKDDEIELPSINYTATALQRRFWQKSNLGFIFINKQVTGNIDDVDTEKAFNRVAGLDFNYVSDDNRWFGKTFYHQSFQNEDLKNSYSHGLSVNYTSRKLNYGWTHRFIGDNFNPEVGFLPRTGYRSINPEIQYFFFPEKGFVVNHGPGIKAESIWDNSGLNTDRQINLNYEFGFQDLSTLTLSVQQDYTYLFSAFDPSKSGGLKLDAGTDYTYNSYIINYKSDERKVINGEIETSGGQYYNGTLYSITGEVNFRMQPYGTLSCIFSYNKVNLEAPYSDADIYLVSPKFDFTFTKTLFFTTFFQYNSQYDNINVNSRIQWRFKPVSDLFLVYTDNYFYDFADRTNNFNVKNRALVLKLTYWLNL